MKIDCYLSEHCGSYHQLRRNIEDALAGLKVSAEVEYHTIYYDDAVALDLRGSPTVRLNGKDLFPGSGSPGIT